MSRRAAIGVDLGGTNLKAAVVDDEGTILAADAHATEAEHGPDHVVRLIGAMVADLRARTRHSHHEWTATGIGSPGPLDLRRGVILKAANLPGWNDVPLRDRLADALRCRVVLDNDANAAAYGEYWVGAGRDGRDFVLLTLGTGIGAGVVLDGQVLHGNFDNAAELGHWIVVPDGLPCPCGQRGCLEQYASAGAVARRAVEGMTVENRGDRGHDATQRPGQRPNPYGAIPDAKWVASRAQAGDPICSRIWDDACRFLAVACINIQHAYNPARVAFSGGMSESGNFLLDSIRRHMEELRWRLHDDFPELALATLGPNAGVIGAAGLALHSSP